MKKLHNLLAVAILAGCIASNPAQAMYAHEMLNPETVAAVAAGSLPATCRLLADDLVSLKPIYIDCNSVNGLSASPIAGSFTTVLASGTITGGAASNIAINTNKFTVAASSGNTAIGGTLVNTGLTTTTGGLLSIVTNDFHTPYSAGETANPVAMVTYGTCTVASVNADICVILTGVASRTITVTHFDIKAVGSAATCTGVLLEDNNGSPVVVATLAAAQLTNLAHNVPLAATLGVGFGAGSGLTVAKGLQLDVNGSGCTTTTSFLYAVTYTVQ